MALASVRRHGAFSPHLLRHLSSAYPESSHAFDPEIRRLAKFQRFSDIETLLESRKQELPTDPFAREIQLASSIICYASCGMLDHALRTIDDLPRLGSLRTLHSFNALLSACNHCKSLLSRVPDLFNDLSHRHSLSPDKISYGILIKSYCLQRDSSRALIVLKEMEEKKVEITVVSYTTIMDSFYKEGKPEEADRLWEEMHAKGVALDTVTYNVRIRHHSRMGKPDDVLRLIEEMKSVGLEPDTFTYNYLMSCYCSHGLVDDAKRVYREFEEKGCKPNAVTFKNLLHDLCKKKDFEGGIEVFGDSVKSGRIPDIGSVMMLVNGLMSGPKTRAAKRVISKLKQKFPDKFVGCWKKLEKVVGLSTDEPLNDQT